MVLGVDTILLSCVDGGVLPSRRRCQTLGKLSDAVPTSSFFEKSLDGVVKKIVKVRG